MTPWRFARFYRRVRYVVGLPAGMVENTELRESERLERHRAVD